ncbi:hypothetical protein Poly51_34610 [Rubripirellula tenax]|uniref:Uncharacterized protein n=2 Tax=Rubripirellula tenax TaxID=2528015 RepID=A0A5C6F0D2_9BACT|nr:hypothetical protein Poly51_34610 [Rubripirellula tenax]
MGSLDIVITAIVVIHASIIGLDFLGAIAVVTNRFHVARLRWWQCLYLSIVFVKSLSLLFIDACPLTIAENYCRSLGHVDTSYGGSFISHYLPRIPTEVDIVVTCLLMLTGLVAVLRVGHQQIATCLATSHARSVH